MKDLVTTRDAEEADLLAVVEMAREFHEHVGGEDFGEFDENAAAGTILAMIPNEDGSLIVAEHDGQIVGMIAASAYHPLFSSSARIAQEICWWVNPSARSLGAGVALIKALVEWAKEADVTTLNMHAISRGSPKKAQAVYEHMGFELSEYVWSLKI